MKIIYFIDFPLIIGGSGKVLMIQAHIMQQRGHDVLVVVPDDMNGNHLEVYDVLLRQYDLRYISAKYTVAINMYEINIVDAMRNYYSIIRILEEFSPDIIHSAQINVAVELAARSLRIPHLMNVYQVEKDSFDFDWMDIYPHYHSADSILFSERWKTGLNIVSRCIRVAYDLNNCNGNRKKIGESLHIFSIGVLCSRKNQMEIIRLVRHCKEENLCVQLTFLGECQNDYGEQCKKYVRDNCLEDYVTFEGFVSNVKEYLVNADLLIVASTVESYPGVIVEGMANRVPILSTPVAGVPELLIDEYNGFLTKGYKEEDLYAALHRYLRFKANGEINNVINHAYQTVEENHSYQVVGENLETYYHWIVDHYKTIEAEQIGINEIHKIFDRYIVNFKNEREVELHVWCLYYIKQRIGTKKIVIWGAGKIGTNTLVCLQLMGYAEQLVGFIDTYKRGEYMGYPILKSLEDIKGSVYVVLVAIGDPETKKEVRNLMESHGMKKHRDFYFVQPGIVDI